MIIQLGDKARDPVTGFEGIVVCRSEYISGCVRVSIQPPVDKEGKIPELGNFDEPMVELVKAQAIKTKISNNGGPRPAPSQHAAPVR